MWTEYDQAQRPIQCSTRDDANGDLLYRTSLKYNKYNNLIKFAEQVGTAEYDTYYNFDTDNRTEKIAYQSGATIRGIEYLYDGVGRIATIKRGTATIESGKTVKVTENSALRTQYTFVPGATIGGKVSTTPLIATITTGTGENQVAYAYAYDDLGNIVSDTRADKVITYVYDKLGQLTRVNDPHENATWTYEYDRGGNMLNKKKFAYTTGTVGSVLATYAYKYDDANWKDKLTRIIETVGGVTTTKAIGYKPAGQDIGNPDTYDGWAYEWQAGRQLKKMLKGTEQTVTNAQGKSVQKLLTGERVEFRYNASGLRVQKVHSEVITAGNPTTVRVKTTDYTLHGKLVMNQKHTVAMETVDANGNVLTSTVSTTNVMHFFFGLRTVWAVVPTRCSGAAEAFSLSSPLQHSLRSA